MSQRVSRFSFHNFQQLLHSPPKPCTLIPEVQFFTHQQQGVCVLKTEGKWEELTPNERLLLLAVAHQLQKTKGLRVPFEKVQTSCGLSDGEFEMTLKLLYLGGRVTRNDWGIILTGDAASDELLGVKSAENEERLASALQEQLKLSFA